MIQKYNRDDIVVQLVTHPQDSLEFEFPEDYAYSPYTKARTFYHPHHQRFYGVTIELFCDLPGLPRSGRDDLVTVSFVMRRVDDPTAERGWFVDGTGKGKWAEFEPPPDGDTGPPVFTVPAGFTEQEFPMARVPAGSCTKAATRSVWFGLISTLSGEMETATLAKLDPSYRYAIRCVARRGQPPRRQDCRIVTWSAKSAAFVLVKFDDKDGLATRVVPGVPPTGGKVLKAITPLPPVTDPLCISRGR